MRLAAAIASVSFLILLFSGACVMSPVVGGALDSVCPPLNMSGSLGGHEAHRIPADVFSFELPRAFDFAPAGVITLFLSAAATFVALAVVTALSLAIRPRIFQPPRLYEKFVRLFSRGILHGQYYA